MSDDDKRKGQAAGGVAGAMAAGVAAGLVAGAILDGEDAKRSVEPYQVTDAPVARTMDPFDDVVPPAPAVGEPHRSAPLESSVAIHDAGAGIAGSADSSMPVAAAKQVAATQATTTSPLDGPLVDQTEKLEQMVPAVSEAQASPSKVLDDASLAAVDSVVIKSMDMGDPVAPKDAGIDVTAVPKDPAGIGVTEAAGTEDPLGAKGQPGPKGPVGPHGEAGELPAGAEAPIHGKGLDSTIVDEPLTGDGPTQSSAAPQAAPPADPVEAVEVAEAVPAAPLPQLVVNSSYQYSPPPPTPSPVQSLLPTSPIPVTYLPSPTDQGEAAISFSDVLGPDRIEFFQALRQAGASVTMPQLATQFGASDATLGEIARHFGVDPAAVLSHFEIGGPSEGPTPQQVAQQMSAQQIAPPTVQIQEGDEPVYIPLTNPTGPAPDLVLSGQVHQDAPDGSGFNLLVDGLPDGDGQFLPDDT